MFKDKEAKEIFYDFEENFYKNNFEQDNGALFLDRDGVVIKDVNYISDPNDVQIESGVLNLFNEANKYKWPVIIVTNQSGISRGFSSWEDFYKVNSRIMQYIGKPNPIYSIYANSHINFDLKHWRKPNPLMIKGASKRFNFNLGKSIMVGDRLSDLQAGIRSGITNLVHVETGHGLDEKNKILENIDKDGFFVDSRLKSHINLIKNLGSFPFELLKK